MEGEYEQSESKSGKTGQVHKWEDCSIMNSKMIRNKGKNQVIFHEASNPVWVKFISLSLKSGKCYYVVQCKHQITVFSFSIDIQTLIWRSFVESLRNSQLSQILKDNEPQTLFEEAANIINDHYGAAAVDSARNCFDLTVKLFHGNFRNYRKCNTEYHDLPHTVDVMLSAVRILDGYMLIHGKIDESLATQLLMSALLHDAGYIQKKNDITGTGAKYTFHHVERSMDFGRRHQKELFLTEAAADAVARIIKATEFSIDFRTLSYASAEEKKVGAMLATADLIGQMADRMYLEKLLFLYYEFREAGVPGFDTEFDILRNTVNFYEVTSRRLDEQLGNIGRYARLHFKKRHNIDENLYETAIERNMVYLHKIMNDTTTNFRHKMKRGKFQEFRNNP